MRRRAHLVVHWLLTLLVPTAIVGTTVWFDFHNENVLIADHLWKFLRLLAGGLLVAASVGAVNEVRRHASLPYVAKLFTYSVVTAVTGAYAMVLADYTRFEKVYYMRLLHDGGFLFLVTFVAIGAKHLEALHYRIRQKAPPFRAGDEWRGSLVTRSHLAGRSFHAASPDAALSSRPGLGLQALR